MKEDSVASPPQRAHSSLLLVDSTSMSVSVLIVLIEQTLFFFVWLFVWIFLSQKRYDLSMKCFQLQVYKAYHSSDRILFSGVISFSAWCDKSARHTLVISALNLIGPALFRIIIFPLNFWCVQMKATCFVVAVVESSLSFLRRRSKHFLHDVIFRFCNQETQPVPSSLDDVHCSGK